MKIILKKSLIFGCLILFTLSWQTSFAQYLITGSWDGTFKIWDTSDTNPKKWKEIESLTIGGPDGSPIPGVFSPSGRYLASHYIYKKSVTGKRQRKRKIIWPSSHIIPFNKTITIWDPEKKIIIKRLDHQSPVTSVAFSPKSNLLASGLLNGTLVIWNISDKDPKNWKSKILDQKVRFPPSISCVTFSLNGKYLASGSIKGIIKIRDISDKNPENWKTKTITSDDPKNVRVIALSSDGKHLASFQDKVIKIWDVPKQKIIKTIDTKKWSISSLAFSPDDKYLASGSEDGTIRVWNISNIEKLTKKILRGHTGDIYTMAFTPFASPFTEKEKKKQIMETAKQDPEERITFIKKQDIVKEGQEELEIKIKGKKEEKLKMPKIWLGFE